MTFEQYPLRIPNPKKIEKKINELITELNNSQTAQEAIKTVNKYFKFSSDLNTDITVISIRHSIDTTDKTYDDANEKINEVSPLIQGYDNQFSKALLNSKFRKELEDKFGAYLFQILENNLRCFDEKIINDLQEENRLVSSYENLLSSAQIPFNGEILNLSQLGKYLSDPDRDTRISSARAFYGFLEEHDQEFGDIYDKLVKIRTKMAKELGFDNFTELGYLRLGRLDYNAEMVAKYREQIKEVVVPVTAKLRKRQAKRLNIENPIFLDYNLEFLSGNAKPIGNTEYLVSQATLMYNEMSPETSEFFKFMVDNHLMDLDAKKGKMSGGYMTYMPRYKAPFIFANSNGTASDVDTLTHEVGHAFQAYLTRNVKVPQYQMPTLESCEIDSMSMEFFAYPWMEHFFGEEAEKYKFGHLSGAISFLPYGCEVDEFQHWVYANPEATHAERCQKWAELDKIYRPWMNYGDFEYVKKGTIWIRQTHIFCNPFYYIDYTLAQVLALEFKCEMDKNREKAWKKYIKLLKMGGKYPFLTLISKDKLRNPFIDGNVKKVIAPQIKILNSIDDSKF